MENEGVNFQEKILLDIAKRNFERIATNTIRNMQGYKDGLLSGDDTVLKNAWDEICVQVQYERSFYWFAYLEMMEQYVRYEVQKLSEEIQMALWIETSEGYDWSGEVGDVPSDVESSIVDHIIHAHVLEQAADWTNERIRYFLERTAIRD